MKSRIIALLPIVSLLVAPLIGWGQVPTIAQGRIIVPGSSIEQPEDIGKRAHTNHLLLARPGAVGTEPSGETPGSLGCVYEITTALLSSGYPLNTTAVPLGVRGRLPLSMRSITPPRKTT